MTEILTESFCERCGTRYTFESAAPRKSRLGRVRTLSRGMRNFVLSDESTLSEALADARSEEELAATAHQLDAFHRTFNFCLTCRQYTCATCWNDAAGRCLTCAPLPEAQSAAQTAFEPAVAGFVESGQDEAGANLFALPAGASELAELDFDEEPSVSAERLALAIGSEPAVEEPAELATEREPEPESLAEPEVELLAEPEPVLLAEPQAERDAEHLTAEPEARPEVEGLEPGQSLQDAIAAYEAQLDAAEDVASGESEVEIVEAEVAEPEVAVAADVSIGEPVAAAPESVPPEPEPAVVAAEDLVAQPTWPTPTAPLPVSPTPGRPTPRHEPAEPAATPSWLTVAPETPTPGAQPVNGAEPQWPSRPIQPVATVRDDLPRTLAGRPLLVPTETTGLWAASSREVLGRPGVNGPAQASAPLAPQPCVSCGLSLSANARFCRRCGARQG